MTDNSMLLVLNSYGIHIPKLFADTYGQNIVNRNSLKDELDILKRGADDENYWEAWEEILLKGTFRLNGTRYILLHSDDLWAVPVKEAELIGDWS